MESVLEDILGVISYFLEKKDVTSLRLTCKSWSHIPYRHVSLCITDDMAVLHPLSKLIPHKEWVTLDSLSITPPSRWNNKCAQSWNHSPIECPEIMQSISSIRRLTSFSMNRCMCSSLSSLLPQKRTLKHLSFESCDIQDYSHLSQLNIISFKIHFRMNLENIDADYLLGCLPANIQKIHMCVKSYPRKDFRFIEIMRFNDFSQLYRFENLRWLCLEGIQSLYMKCPLDISKFSLLEQLIVIDPPFQSILGLDTVIHLHTFELSCGQGNMIPILEFDDSVEARMFYYTTKLSCKWVRNLSLRMISIKRYDEFKFKFPLLEKLKISCTKIHDTSFVIDQPTLKVMFLENVQSYWNMPLFYLHIQSPLVSLHLDLVCAKPLDLSYVADTLKELFITRCHLNQRYNCADNDDPPYFSVYTCDSSDEYDASTTDILSFHVLESLVLDDNILKSCIVLNMPRLKNLQVTGNKGLEKLGIQNLPTLDKCIIDPAELFV